MELNQQYSNERNALQEELNRLRNDQVVANNQVVLYNNQQINDREFINFLHQHINDIRQAYNVLLNNYNNLAAQLANDRNQYRFNAQYIQNIQHNQILQLDPQLIDEYIQRHHRYLQQRDQPQLLGNNGLLAIQQGQPQGPIALPAGPNQNPDQPIALGYPNQGQNNNRLENAGNGNDRNQANQLMHQNGQAQGQGLNNRPIQGAVNNIDGNHYLQGSGYIPDPNNPGQFIRVSQRIRDRGQGQNNLIPGMGQGAGGQNGVFDNRYVRDNNEGNQD